MYSTNAWMEAIKIMAQTLHKLHLKADNTTTVRIQYDGYDPDLDSVLETSLILLGFELEGKGFNMENEERDLVFRRAIPPPANEEKD